MKTHFYVLLFLFNLSLFAQNNNCGTPTPNDFVINGGFEQFSSLPNSPGQLTRACNWLDNANIATPDYFHRNSQQVDMSLPQNPRGPQEVNPVHGGDAYAGFAVQQRMFNNNPVVYTEIIGTQLASSLQPGTQYDLSFDISQADNMGPNPIRVQAYLGSQFALNTEHELPNPNGLLLQNTAFSNNTSGWDTITFRFTASAGQNFLYIGGISNTQFQNPNGGGFLPTYYYIDNVSLVVASNCNNESINITTQLPDCNIFENSSTFDICGTFTTSATATSYNLSLNVDDLDDGFLFATNSPITNISNVTTSSGITSGDFCITLNESNFNLNHNYQIDVQINSQVSGQPCRVNSNNILLPFDDCIVTSDPCEGTSLTITNEDTIPTCEQLGDYWSYFPIDIAINVPDGYDLTQAASDYTNYFSLDIIDLDSQNNDIYGTLFNAAPGSASLENGIFELRYLITMQDVPNTGTYAFRMNATITTENGLCELSYTAYELSFDDCQEIDPCATITEYNIDGSILCWEDITDEDYFIEFQRSNDCPNSSSTEPPLNIYQFQQNDNCIDLQNIVNHLDSKCFRWRVSTLCGDWSDWCLVGVGGPPDYGYIDYEDCIPSSVSDCEEFDLQVTTDIPKCEELGSSFSFDVCGTFCDDQVNGPYLANMYLEILDVDNNNEVIETINVGSGLGIGTFCFQLANENFTNGLVGNYDFRITGVFTDASVQSESITIVDAISFEPCPIECNDIKDVKLEDGFFLTWDPEVQAEEYTFAFALNSECDPHYDPTDLNYDSFTTTNNYIDLRGWSKKFDKCLTFKIISNCGSKTKWCTIKWVDDHYEWLSENCLNEERIMQHIVKVSPNPAKNKLSVSTEISKMKSIEIYNIYGKAVQIFKSVDALKQTIDVNRLSRGYYVIKVTLEDGSSQYKNVILK